LDEQETWKECISPIIEPFLVAEDVNRIDCVSPIWQNVWNTPNGQLFIIQNFIQTGRNHSLEFITQDCVPQHVLKLLKCLINQKIREITLMSLRTILNSNYRIFVNIFEQFDINTSLVICKSSQSENQTLLKHILNFNLPG